MRKSTFTPAYGALKARLRKMREAAGLSQRELAVKLGREPSLVARLEQGERRIDLIELIWVCQALRVPVEKTLLDLVREIGVIEKAEKRSRRSL